MSTEHITGSRIERFATTHPNACTVLALVFLVGLLLIGGLLDGAP